LSYRPPFGRSDEEPRHARSKPGDDDALIQARQHALRNEAGRGGQGPFILPLRRAFGNLLIQFGEWLGGVPASPLPPLDSPETAAAT
jgi:hypothetical protein